VTVGLLESKVIAITGAGRGLGRAYAVAAAAQGAHLVLNDVDGDALRESTAAVSALGGRVVSVTGSVVDPGTADSIVDTAVREFGALDGLVNNAAISPVGLPWELSPELLARTIDIDVKGVLHCGVAALQVMVPRGTGSIVNIISGAIFGIPKLSVYGAAKGAVLATTYGWAVDLAGTGVRVNGLSPLARTRLTADVDGAGDQSNILLPEAIAPAVVYLLSDLSRQVHGQVIRFDGRVAALQSPPTFLASSGVRQEWSPETIGEFVALNTDRLKTPGLRDSVPAELRAPD
jgi:NAD(P)-dependent dehydrogenase (short-subunit alcohol dehydrogenase family)